MKTLVVYYSLSGTTKYVANEFAKELNATIEEIVSLKNYGQFAHLIGSKDAFTKVEVPIKQMINNPTDFDLLIVLSPVWALTITPPVYSYLKNLKRSNLKAIVCVTHQGMPGNALSDSSKVLAEKGYHVMETFALRATEKGAVKKVLDSIKQLI